jgi:hypothetical protein
MDLEERDLAEEMSNDRIVIDYLSDSFIATTFYSALCNVEWYTKKPQLPDDELIVSKLKGEKEPYWSCSWRSAGGYISEIRNKYYNTRENYMDFYCAGNEGEVSDLVKECFDRMGWIPRNYLNEYT